jgi:hypothetical protein
MKQFTRVIKRPETIPEDQWRFELCGIYNEVEQGACLAQGEGIFSASFVDLSNFSLIITIIQFDHASKKDITEVHQAITEFIEALSANKLNLQ